MSESVLLQWSFVPPAGRQVPLADLILPRVLEHYGLHTPVRTTTQFRTYRAQFPSTSGSTAAVKGSDLQQAHSRYLTTITSLPPPPAPHLPGQAQATPLKTDETAYLFLDDRTPIPSTSAGQSMSTTGVPEDVGTGDASKARPKLPDEPMVIDGDASLADDGFEIIDKPAGVDASGAVSSSTQPDNGNGAVPRSTTTSDGPSLPAPTAENRQKRFRCISVRPASNVAPMLQNLLSPFVLGLTKNSRAAASTTSSLPTPTPLPGSTLLLTQLSFNPCPLPPLSPDRDGLSTEATPPQVILTVHILPSPTAGSIFLSAEYAAGVQPALLADKQNRQAKIDRLKAFLAGCLVEGIDGQTKWVVEDLPEHLPLGSRGQQERNKRSAFALARTMREAAFI
ncbi:hypothetical protein IAU60_000174 [Kwoniella sp. DSM 27419]